VHILPGSSFYTRIIFSENDQQLFIGIGLGTETGYRPLEKESGMM
jgi:hypothetical protein